MGTCPGTCPSATRLTTHRPPRKKLHRRSFQRKTSTPSHRSTTANRDANSRAKASSKRLGCKQPSRHHSSTTTTVAPHAAPRCWRRTTSGAVDRSCGCHFLELDDARSSSSTDTTSHLHSLTKTDARRPTARTTQKKKRNITITRTHGKQNNKHNAVRGRASARAHAAHSKGEGQSRHGTMATSANETSAGARPGVSSAATGAQASRAHRATATTQLASR